MPLHPQHDFTFSSSGLNLPMGVGRPVQRHHLDVRHGNDAIRVTPEQIAKRRTVRTVMQPLRIDAASRCVGQIRRKIVHINRRTAGFAQIHGRRRAVEELQDRVQAFRLVRTQHINIVARGVIYRAVGLAEPKAVRL